MRAAQKKTETASLLVTMLFFTFVLSMLVAFCLSRMSFQRVAVERSKSWNDALPLAEAGIEEALTHLQFVSGQNYATNGWTAVQTASGATNYVRASTNLVNYGTNLVNNGYYQTVIIPPATYGPGYGPTIISTGFVAVPLSPNQYVTRAVSVQTSLNSGAYAMGLISKSTINLNPSSGAYIDSYNSTNGLYSTSIRHANACIGTISTSADISLGSGSHLYGYLVVPPNYSSNGIVLQTTSVVGDIPYLTAGNLGTIQSGHYLNTLTATIPNVVGPDTNAAPAIAAGSYSYGGTNYNYGLGSGLYRSGDLPLNSKTMVVSGNAVLFVGGTITIDSASSIYIAPGASLTMYVYNNFTLNGTIHNSTMRPANCVIKGLQFCTGVTIQPATPFIGVINTPYGNANTTLSAGADMSGAILAYSISLGGSGNFHYDESLGGANSGLQYSVTVWQELTN